MRSGLGTGGWGVDRLKLYAKKRIRVIPRRGISESQREGVLRGLTARDTAIEGMCMCPVPSRRAARAGHDNAVPCMREKREN
jgi:hypothetical protein